MLAMKIQFEITRQAVEKWNPDIVLFDGALLLHFGLMLSNDATEEYWKNSRSTAKAAVELLHICHERKIPVVGFVKRT